jgi:hypothetical protein
VWWGPHTLAAELLSTARSCSRRGVAAARLCSEGLLLFRNTFIGSVIVDVLNGQKTLRGVSSYQFVSSPPCQHLANNVVFTVF